MNVAAKRALSSVTVPLSSEQLSKRRFEEYPQEHGFELIAFPSKVVPFSAECPDYADRTAATPRVFELQTKSNSSFCQ